MELIKLGILTYGLFAVICLSLACLFIKKVEQQEKQKWI